MFKIRCVNIVGSKHGVKWRHYAVSAKFITIYWSNRSIYRYSWIIYKIAIFNHIIPIKIFFINNFSIKIIFLANNSLIC